MTLKVELKTLAELYNNVRHRRFELQRAEPKGIGQVVGPYPAAKNPALSCVG